MKVVILAGGFGTRISEESHLIPKPMIEIGEKPILWHIMKYYTFFGYNDFVVCCGYKQYVIKEFFADYYLHMSDATFDFTDGNCNLRLIIVFKILSLYFWLLFTNFNNKIAQIKEGILK
jgi:NDP-sugar pyrophosphorylase family protein